MTLTVNENHTFLFNRTTPFFPSLSGKWTFNDDGDLAIATCTYDNTTIDFQLIDGFETWTFQGNNLKNGKEGDLIVFTKK